MWACLLLCLAQEPAPPPFTIALPEGYEAFTPAPNQPGSWSARRADGQARLSVQHYELGMPGAKLDAVLEDLATRQWRPILKTVAAPSLERWQGQLSGLEAGGWEVRYRHEDKAMAISQHLALAGDQMIVLLWEGPAEARQAMDSVFDSLVVPDSWLPQAMPTVDAARGLGSGLSQPFAGSLAVEVDLRAFHDDQEAIDLKVSYLPAPGQEAAATTDWTLPPAAQALAAVPGDSALTVRYRLLLDEDHGLGSGYGITRLPGRSMALLDPLWLAIPAVGMVAGSDTAPPSWTLTTHHSAQIRTLSSQPATTSFDEASGTMSSHFAALAPGQAWPFLIFAEYQRRRDEGVDWWLRLDAKAITPEAVVAAWHRLNLSADQLWGPIPAPSFASFPYLGDRVLPGLFLLDEERGWFNHPLDSELDGQPRLTQLARLVAQERFGARLHGDGSAAQFLERSLAEYAAFRLLSVCDLPDAAAQAEALKASWSQREAALGPLPLPLSLLPVDDLYGPRRLLSFGPLVWSAIANRLGTDAFDAMLKAQLAAAPRWSCADLEAALHEAQPQAEWENFLRASLYGRDLPQD